MPPEEGDCSVTAVDEVAAAAPAVDVMTAAFWRDDVLDVIGALSVASVGVDLAADSAWLVLCVVWVVLSAGEFFEDLIEGVTAAVVCSVLVDFARLLEVASVVVGSTSADPFERVT